MADAPIYSPMNPKMPNIRVSDVRTAATTTQSGMQDGESIGILKRNS